MATIGILKYCSAGGAGDVGVLVLVYQYECVYLCVVKQNNRADLTCLKVRVNKVSALSHWVAEHRPLP